MAVGICLAVDDFSGQGVLRTDISLFLKRSEPKAVGLSSRQHCLDGRIRYPEVVKSLFVEDVI